MPHMEVKPLGARSDQTQETKGVTFEGKEEETEQESDGTKRSHIREAIEEAKQSILALQDKTWDKVPKLSESQRFVQAFEGTGVMDQRKQKTKPKSDGTKQGQAIESIGEARRSILALEAKTGERAPNLGGNQRFLKTSGGRKENAELKQRLRRYSADEIRNPEAIRSVFVLRHAESGKEETKQDGKQLSDRFSWEEKLKRGLEPDLSQAKHSKGPSSLVWDCGSTLYDSFELNSLKRQLDSAIAASARTMSMPHFPDRRAPPPAPPATKKSMGKLSRSFHRLLRSVFRLKHSSRSSIPITRDGQYHVVYDKTGALTTIPEGAESDAGAPEMGSAVRKTASERFTASQTIGMSCA